MKYRVIHSLKVKTIAGEYVELPLNQIIELAEEKAKLLLERGKIIPLNKFDYYILSYSNLLREKMILAPDYMEASVLRPLDCPVYYFHEIEFLQGMSPYELETINKIKKRFKNSRIIARKEQKPCL